MEIVTTDGATVLVDDEDFSILSRHNWYLNYSGKRPYAITKMKTDQSKIWRCIFMHHLIMGTATCVDHLDNNPLNNQKANLRKATRQQNNINKPKAPNKLGKPTSSKYKGVHKYSHNGKFRVCIGHNRKVIQLGTFDNEDDAARAYNAKALELFGEYAWLNPVPPKVNRIEGGES